MLAPTPSEWLCDRQGRPYFLWDVDITLAEFMEKLRDPDAEVRAYWIGKVMRQAKVDDAITLLGRDAIIAAWPVLKGRLGRENSFWEWWVARHGV